MFIAEEVGNDGCKVKKVEEASVIITPWRRDHNAVLSQALKIMNTKLNNVESLLLEFSNQRIGVGKVEEALVITAPWRRDHNADFLQSFNYKGVRRRFSNYLKKVGNFFGDPRDMSLNSTADAGLLEGDT